MVSPFVNRILYCTELYSMVWTSYGTVQYNVTVWCWFVWFCTSIWYDMVQQSSHCLALLQVKSVQVGSVAVAADRAVYLEGICMTMHA